MIDMKVMEYDIFVSYSRNDKDLVHDFVRQLQHRGLSVWIDWTGIKSGDKFKEEIVNAIESAKIVLFFSSTNSNKSEWVKSEISIAKNRGKRIIPIRIDEAPYDKNIEMDLTLVDSVDYSKKENRQFVFNRLVRALWQQISLSISDNQNLTESCGDLNLTHFRKNTYTFLKYIVLVLCLLLSVLLLIGLKEYVYYIDNRRYDDSVKRVKDNIELKERWIKCDMKEKMKERFVGELTRKPGYDIKTLNKDIESCFE